MLYAFLALLEHKDESSNEKKLEDLIHYTKNKSILKYYKPISKEFTTNEITKLFPINKPTFIKKYNLSNELSVNVLKADNEINFCGRDIVSFDNFDKILVDALHTSKQFDLKLPYILELLSVCYWTNEIEKFFKLLVIANENWFNTTNCDECIVAMIQNIKKLYNNHYCVYESSILVDEWLLFKQFWSSTSISKSIYIRNNWWDCKYDLVAEYSNNVSEIYIDFCKQSLPNEFYFKLFRFIKCLNTTTRTKLLDIRHFNYDDADKFINGLDKYICNIDVLRFYYYSGKKPEKISQHIKNSNHDIKHIVFV